jgi:hypothetical protein
MDFPVYEIQEELFSSSACNGPLLGLTRMISGTNAGIVTCRLSNSSRYGATTSTLKIYAGDSVFVPISHPAIPKPGSSGGSSSGGSSSGSSSGGTTGTTVVPTCTAAPDTPNLSIEWNTTGPKFTFSPALGGQKATALFWSYALLNSVSNTWESWSNSVVAPVATGTYQASVTEGKSRIAFSVQAANACGGSAQAREVNGNTGVALAPLEFDQITLASPLPTSIKAGATVELYGVAKSRLGLVLESASLTPTVCSTDNTKTIKLITAGVCRLSVSSGVFQNKMGASSIPIEFEISSPKRQQNIVIDYREKYYLPGTLYVIDGLQASVPNTIFAHSDSNLPIVFESNTESVCRFSIPNWLSLNQPGTCELRISQRGNGEYEAETKLVQFEVSSETDPALVALSSSVKKKLTLTCVKGKLTKKVTGTSPKCPTGYKVKK